MIGMTMPGRWGRSIRGVLAAALVALAPSVLVASAADPLPRDPILFQPVGNALQVPEGVVYAVVQDGQGLVWFATTGGLVRYDGYRFRIYRQVRGDSGSLPGNVVRALLRDRGGRLWVGTEAEGIALYDPATDRFDRFGVREGLPLDPVRALAEDRDGAIWIGTTGGGLVRLDPVRRTARVLRHDPAVPGSLPDDRISALAVDGLGQLWVGTWRGLARRRPGIEAFETELSEPGDPLGFAHSRIRAIVPMASGDLWIGSQQGHMAMVSAAARGRAGPLGNDGVRRWLGRGMNTAAEPLPGEVWIGHAAGIDVHSAKDARLLRVIRPAPGRDHGLPAADVRSLLVDRSGLLWVGTFGGGVQRADPRPRGLTSRRWRPGEDPPFEQFNVLTLADDGAGGLWLGLAGEGLVRMDRDLVVREVLSTGGASGFEGDQPSGLARGTDGTLWVATERGLFRRPPGVARFQPVGSAAFVEGATVRRLWLAPDGGVWIGTADGLFRWLPDGDGIRRLAQPDGGAVGGNIEALALGDGDTDQGWLGGSRGLMRLDVRRDVLVPVRTRVDGAARLLDVDGLKVDRAGVLWVDAGGLMRLVREEDGVAEFESVSARHGEEGVSFGANLLDDGQGRLWTHRALYDPATDAFRVLDAADGAQVGTGWFRAFARMADGRLAFGAREGLLVIDPPHFTPWRDVPPVVVTEVRIDGVRTPLGPDARRIHLEAGQRDFTVEFAALDFSAPHLNRYRYRLDGVDRDWVEATHESRLATYGNLWPGTYRFEVQGSNRNGEWNPDSRSLEVRIDPRWWQTQSAALLALVAAGVLLTLAVRWRTTRLRVARAVLEREVEARTAELRILSEALRTKTREFEEASLTDPLTGLRNRRFMSLEMKSELALWQRRQGQDDGRLPARGMVVFLIDIDHFKPINDRHGHAAGDDLLVHFAARLREVFRASDHLVRWGGEEFLVVSRDTTREGAAELAERVRVAVAGRVFDTQGGRLRVTCSIGYAPLPWDPALPNALDWEAVVALSDLALYTVKASGRDGWLGLTPTVGLPVGADLAWLLQRLPRLVVSGDVRLSSNLDIDRLAHHIVAQAR